ncbi:Ankyrin [Fusarium sp. LHS14.1]|nr:Ankyrin [Fusarium sp. LHS14.1]
MDVFSFGMLAWTVVQNGKCVLAALASQMDVPPHGVDDFLKKQKQSSNFIDLVKQAVQLPGYCGDILLEDFTAVLESTLRTPQSRDLDQALNSLRKICRSDRTGERSPLRLIEDFDSKLDGSQNSNFDFKVVKNFPRPLQRQILATKMQRLSATGQKPLGLDLSGYNPTEEAIQLFRMVHESMGADTLGERILHNRALESAIREAMGDDAGPTRGAETQQGQEVAGPGGSWLPRLTKHLEQLIVGSICAGPNSFGPSKYRGYLNQKLATCLELLSEAIEKGAEDILPSSLAVACIVALGRPHWLPEETVIGWLQQAPYGGLLSLLDHLEPADRYSAKLEVLQIVANVKDTLQAVEVNETFNGMKFGSSSAVDRQLLVHELHDRLLRAGKDQPVNEELIPRRLFDIAPFVEKLPELKEQLSHSTSDIINYQDKDGRTPLLMACLYGNVEAARLLHSHGANAALASHTGQSVFHCLPYIDPSLQSEFAEELLKAGADPNSKITLGLRIRGSSSPDFPTVSLMRSTPLHHAILNGSLGSVVALLACGADKLLEDSNYLSPLALAAAAHCPDILDCLIQSTETNVATWMDHYGNSLVFAALDGQWNMVRMHLNTTNYYHYAAKTLKVLQDRGANWDVVSYRYSVPALRFACFSSSSFIVSQLIEMGLGSQINLDQQATIPWPLHQAILRGDEHIFMLLLDNGADIHVRASSTGDTCLHACVKAEFEDHFFLEVLLERGAEIDAGDQNGRTALYEAVVRKQFRTATYLLSRGANLEHRDVLGLTVLGSVLESGDNVLPCLGYLLGPAHPFSISDFIVGRNNSTVLHAAAGAYKTWRTASETRGLFEYLLNKFPYKEHLESQEATSGFTPLMIAVLGNDVEAAKALVEAGASLDTKCLSGLCLRRAEMLTKLVVASSNGLATGLDFDDNHGGRVWRDMMKLLLESSVRPIIEPKARPAVSTEEARRHRVGRFVELIRGSKLQCIGDHLERNGTEVAELPAADDPDQSLLDDIAIPEIVLAEIEFHLNEKILECATITKPAGYALSRDNDKYYFVPYLCWVIETETLGTKGSLGEVLKTFPPFPSISLIFCKHIVDSLIVVHEAGFTHGALNMSAVVLRTLTSGQSAISSLIPQLHNFKWSVSEKSKDAVYRKQGNEFDAPELGQSAGEFRRPFRELLKCDVYSLGMVIVHAVAGARIKDLGSFESNPAYVSSAVAAARSSMIKENYSPSIIKKLLVGLQEMLEPEPAKRTCSLRTIHSAIASTLGDHGEAPDEGLAERRRDRLFRSLAGRMKRFGI